MLILLLYHWLAWLATALTVYSITNYVLLTYDIAITMHSKLKQWVEFLQILDCQSLLSIFKYDMMQSKNYKHEVVLWTISSSVEWTANIQLGDKFRIICQSTIASCSQLNSGVYRLLDSVGVVDIMRELSMMYYCLVWKLLLIAECQILSLNMALVFPDHIVDTISAYPVAKFLSSQVITLE